MLILGKPNLIWTEKRRADGVEEGLRSMGGYTNWRTDRDKWSYIVQEARAYKGL